MIIYQEVNASLLTPKINQFIDSYVSKFHKNNLASADLPSMVGELCGYELISTELKCGGYCDGWNRTIAVNDKITPYDTLFHEMGHVMQFELEMFDKCPRLISSNLQMEWQAETIAYELYRKCFPHHHVDKKRFNAYMTKRGWQFLINWYGPWMQNDIEKYM